MQAVSPDGRVELHRFEEVVGAREERQTVRRGTQLALQILGDAFRVSIEALPFNRPGGYVRARARNPF